MNRKLTALTLIAAAVLTNAGFTALGSVFNYPDVLKEPTRDILERFHAHQGAVAGWFAVLACSAALFAPIAIGIGKLRSGRFMRLAVPIGIAAAVVQVVGLSRWPVLAPGFANDAVGSDPTVARDAVDHFHTLNIVLGTAVGETCGYLLTAAWTMLVARSLGARFAGRVFPAVGIASGAMILVGVLSPLEVEAIDLVNFAGYVVWSVWLVWIAVVLLRSSSSSAEGRALDRAGVAG